MLRLSQRLMMNIEFNNENGKLFAFASVKSRLRFYKPNVNFSASNDNSVINSTKSSIIDGMAHQMNVYDPAILTFFPRLRKQIIPI